MTTLTLSAGEITEFWRISRRLHAIYAELDQMFELGQPACPELDSRVDSSDPETMDRVQQWFETMDAHVQVWQLRQLLQSTSLQNEENLRYLIKRHLDRKEKTESDKEKIDFLLVQYFAHCAPHGINEQLLSLDEVAQVLEPALGATPEIYPDWAPGLDDKLQKLNECNCLEDLQNSGGLLEVRELKLAVGDKYFDPGHLVAFTRFNFRARRAFFKAMHLDLHAIRGAVNELERMGYTTLDCREAGLTESESLDQVRHVVHQWKTPFRAPYSGGSSFLQLILLRHALRLKLQEAHARHAGQGGEILEGTYAPAQLMPLIAVPGEPAHAVAVTSAKTESPAMAEMAVGPVGNSSFESADVREIDLDQAPIEPVHVHVQATAPPPPAVHPEAVHLEAVRSKAVHSKAVHSEAVVSQSLVELESPAPPPPAAERANAALDTPVAIVEDPAPAQQETSNAERNAEENDDLHRCVADITAQLVSVPPRHAPTVSAINLGGCKLLIATWEAEAFIFGTDDLSNALKRTVAARTILHVCLERHRKGEPTDLPAALEIAQRQADKMQASVAEAKELKNIDAAVNLAATSKRLLALIEESHKIVG